MTRRRCNHSTPRDIKKQHHGRKMTDRDTVFYDLSASRIKTHASCPEKYNLKYIKQLTPTKGKKGYGEMGSWVHLAIENVLSDHSGDFNEHTLNSKLKQEFFRIGDTDEIDKTVIDDDKKGNALDCLEVAARYISAQSPTIRGLEVPVNFHIDTDAVDRTAYGKIDVVTESGEIWDWKTGSINDNYTPRDELIQGSVYMAGYHNEYGELPEAIKFVYAKEEKVREVEPDEDSWQEMVQYARRLVQNEERGEFEAKPESGKCYFCSFEMYCSASAVGVGGVTEIVADGNYDMWNGI